MTPSTCHICSHGEAFHDRWGICGISECVPCYKELQCPRCQHTFFDHSISDDRVMCVVGDCKLLTCYDKRWPEKPLYTIMNRIENADITSTSATARVTSALVPRRTQPTYEESLQHPLSPQPRIITATVMPLVDDDPQIEPGLWKNYKSGREYVSARNGYIAIDLEEKLPNGAFKHHAMGRTWDTKYRGYVEDTPPGPPERGFLD